MKRDRRCAQPFRNPGQPKESIAMCNDRSDQHHQPGSFNHLNKIDRRDVVLGGGALLTATALAGVALPDLANAQVPKPGADPTPGFNNKIPDKIMTPDKVETRIGTLNFVDGVPTAETTQKVYDHLDFLRGVEVFLNFVPAASLEAVRLGHVEMNASKSNQAIIFDQLMDSNPLFLTGNTDTVYCIVILDLETDGPTVVELPAKSGPGTVNDAFFRFVTDMGPTGPDKGKGGKYLIVPPGYTGVLPKTGYFVARSPSYVNWLILRGFLVDGSPDAAAKMFRNGLKVYPLSRAKNPPKMEFTNRSRVPFNTVHANDFEFYVELDHVFQKEPIDLFDPELRGLAAAIGIRKGQKFAPDARMKAILTDAVAVANATSRAISFRNRDPRTNYFYMATLNTPAIVKKTVGVGSQYAVSYADRSGNPFDGAKNYRLKIPADVPAKDFWSVVLYDPQTRSELQTSQPFPSKN